MDQTLPKQPSACFTIVGLSAFPRLGKGAEILLWKCWWSLWNLQCIADYSNKNISSFRTSFLWFLCFSSNTWISEVEPYIINQNLFIIEFLKLCLIADGPHSSCMSSLYYNFHTSMMSYNFCPINPSSRWQLHFEKEKINLWFKEKRKIYLLNFYLCTLQCVARTICLPSLLLFVVFLLLQRLLSTYKCPFEVGMPFQNLGCISPISNSLFSSFTLLDMNKASILQ